MFENNEVGGKFEGAKLNYFALVLIWIIEKAFECPTSRMKNLLYPTPLILTNGKSLKQCWCPSLAALVRSLMSRLSQLITLNRAVANHHSSIVNAYINIALSFLLLFISVRKWNINNLSNTASGVFQTPPPLKFHILFYCTPPQTHGLHFNCIKNLYTEIQHILFCNGS